MSSTVTPGRRRVVVTGIGVIAPGGIGTKAFWELLTAGRTATRTITLFDPTGFRSRVGAECDFDPRAEGLSPQEIRRMDRAAQCAGGCAREAVSDSGLDLDRVEPDRLAVSIGNAVGCTVGLEQEYVVLSDGGRQWHVDWRYGVPHLYGYMVPTTMSVEVARDCGAEGPVCLISTGCTAGLDALGSDALRLDFRQDRPEQCVGVPVLARASVEGDDVHAGDLLGLTWLAATGSP